jgi:CubicO group peptidase (beta-lactamase class C family)
VESVERFVVEHLAAWKVPGCAVAAVRSGRVELADGRRLQDRGAGLPVTQNTLFAIGSVTKAFTATTVGALVDKRPLESAEFELDDNGAVTRLIVQPLGIFLPKEAS